MEKGKDMEDKISLQDGWQAKLDKDGRLYYLDHATKTSHWLPPPTSWSDEYDLPYGWEGGMDKHGKPYYINHVTRKTTREDPFEIEDVPPVEREVLLNRDPSLGFGFIAGSEKPVVIRSVTDGGPSVGKLLPADKILKINGEDVSKKEGQFIIERIRQSHELIRLTVIQPYIDKTGLKSSFLSAIKKQKLKAKPSRVRFSNNESIATISPNNTKVPPSLVYLPNVLKVYLENGQTKSFKYDNKTTVKDVLHNIQEKLGIKCMEYFSLGVHDIRNPTNQQLTILQDDELVRQTASRPGSQHLKCLLRVTFVPKDAYDLLSRDPTAFDYFYLQCCNDVTSGRFGDELRFDMVVKLAALQIQQHVLCNKQKAKVSIKAVQKDNGLERFLPKSVTDKFKAKELRKVIGQHIKQNQNLTAPGQKHLTELQAKLHYLKVISGLESFGGKIYSGTLLGESEGNLGTAMTVLVGPKVSVSRVLDTRTKSLASLVNFSELSRLKLSRKGPICDDVYKLEMLRRENTSLVFLLHTEDAQDMASLINGYYRLFEDPNHSLLPDDETKQFLMNTEAPLYRGKHRVISAGWNYPSDLVSETVATDNQDSTGMQDGEHIVDLTTGPPVYLYDAAFISKLKEENKFRSKESLDNIDGAQSLESESEAEETTPNRNANNSFFSTSSTDSSASATRKGSLVDLSTFTDLVDSMFNMAPERTEEESDRRNSFSLKAEKKTNEKKRFSFTDAVRPKRKPFSGTKYNVSDSVASNVDLTDGVKLVNYSSFHGNSHPPDREAESSDSDGGDFVDSVPRRKKVGNNSKAAQIKSRDSIYLIRTKVNYSGRNSPTPERFTDDNEDISRREDDKGASHDASVQDISHNSSGVAESDIIDLTHDASVADIDIELSDFNLGMVEELEDLTSSPKIGSEDLDLSIELKERTVKKSDQEEEAEELPVSVIDLPSPDSEEDQELSDEAHGIQMAAIDALNASIAINQAARPLECESDSGNETISSETIENPIDQFGVSHSPNDYFQIMGADEKSSPERLSPDDDGNRTNTSTPDSSTLAGSLPDNSEEADILTPNQSIQNDSIFESAIQDGNDNTDNQIQLNSSAAESNDNSMSSEVIQNVPSPRGTSEIDSVHEISVTSPVNTSTTEYANEDKPDVTGSLMSDQDLDALFALDMTQDSSILDVSNDNDNDVIESEFVESVEETELDIQEDEDISGHIIDNVEEVKVDIETKMEAEDLRHTPTSSLSLTHGSDTDSCTSTLRGSVSNLTSMESTEELNEYLAVDGNLEYGDEEGKMAIDELVLSLMVAPPPSVSTVDEELLGIIIPPPPVDDFDFGTIDDVVAMTPDEDDTEAITLFTGDSVITKSPGDDGTVDTVFTLDDVPNVHKGDVSQDKTVKADLDSEIKDRISPHESEEDNQCIPVEEPISVEGEIPETESSLTKYMDSLKSKQEETAAQTVKPSQISIQHQQEHGSSPRGFRFSTGSVGESLDSGFHQSDSGDLDGGSCFNSLQEAQFVKEKIANGLDADSTTLKTNEVSNEDVKQGKSPREDSLVANMRIEERSESPTFPTEVSVEQSVDESPYVTILKTDENSDITNVDNSSSKLDMKNDSEQSNDCTNIINESTQPDKLIKSESKVDLDEMEAVHLLDALTACLDNVSLASTISSADSCSSKDNNQFENQLRPKPIKPKPAVPPKPAVRPDILSRRQSLDSNLILGAQRIDRHSKGAAPKPPTAKYSPLPTKKATESEASHANLQRSVSMQVYPAGAEKATIEISDAKPTRHGSVASIPSRHPFVKSASIETSQSKESDQIERKERSPVKRSNTISVPAVEQGPDTLYPARKAPPPPMPKPKIKMGISGTWAARGSSGPGKTNPPSIRKLLSPSRTKPWTRGPLPFARIKDPTTPEPEVKPPTKEKKPSLPQKMFYSLTRKEGNKAKHSVGRSDSNRGKIDPPSLRAVSGLKRPSVLDLAERMQQASENNATSPPDSKTMNRSVSLRSPRTLPRTSVVYSPRNPLQSPRTSYTLPSPSVPIRSHSVDQSSHTLNSPRETSLTMSTPPVTLRSNSVSMEYSPRPMHSPRERPKSLPGSPRHFELPKRPPPPRPRAPPRTNSVSSISTLVSEFSDTDSVASLQINSYDGSLATDSPPRTPPTPRQRVNSFSGSISSDSSGTRTPPTPRAIRRNMPSSPPTLSPDDDVFDATSPVPLPSPVPTDMDSSINSDLTSPPPLPNSAPPLPSSAPPSMASSTQAESPQSTSSTRTFDESPIEDDTNSTPNVTLEIEIKEYEGATCVVEAADDIRIILSELRESLDKLTPCTPSIAQFRQCKQVMLMEAREFTSNTKMFVSSAGQSAEQLVSCLNSSMHTIARLCSATQQFIMAIPSVNQAKNLGNKVKEIVSNFRVTIQVAAEAHGMALQHPKMQLLLRQAQTMAILLSALMRTLRILHC